MVHSTTLPLVLSLLTYSSTSITITKHTSSNCSFSGQVAKQFQGHKRARFGISADPKLLTLALQGDVKNVSRNYAAMANKTLTEIGVSSYGTLGLERSIRDIANEPSLTAWFTVRFAESKFDEIWAQVYKGHENECIHIRSLNSAICRPSV